MTTRPLCILVVCWGSSCRSPMAKALLDASLDSANMRVAVEARALCEPARVVASEAVDVMRFRGLDISGHTPTGVTEADLERATLVLVMDKKLLGYARDRWPQHSEKMHRIMEWATGEPSDVIDPHLLGDIYDYEMAAIRLAKAAGQVVSRLGMMG